MTKSQFNALCEGRQAFLEERLKNTIHEATRELHSGLEVVTVKVDEIQIDVRHIKKIITGNGKIGMSAQVETNKKWIEEQTRNKSSIYLFVYRTILGAILIFILAKVGL